MGTKRPAPSPDCVADPNSPVAMVSSTRRVGLAWSASLAPEKEHWIRVGTGVAGVPAAAAGMILAPRLTPHWDSSDVSNAAPHVFANGSVLLGYRAGGDGVALGGGIGFASAAHWNTTMRGWSRVGDGAMAFPAEDGTLWHDGAAFHMLVHRFAAANGSTVGYQVGGHAFSEDGVGWHYSPHPAYNSTVRWAVGSAQPSQPATLYVEN